MDVPYDPESPLSLDSDNDAGTCLKEEQNERVRAAASLKITEILSEPGFGIEKKDVPLALRSGLEGSQVSSGSKFVPAFKQAFTEEAKEISSKENGVLGSWKQGVLYDSDLETPTAVDDDDHFRDSSKNSEPEITREKENESSNKHNTQYKSDENSEPQIRKLDASEKEEQKSSHDKLEKLRSKEDRFEKQKSHEGKLEKYKSKEDKLEKHKSYEGKLDRQKSKEDKLEKHKSNEGKLERRKSNDGKSERQKSHYDRSEKEKMKEHKSEKLKQGESRSGKHKSHEGEPEKRKSHHKTSEKESRDDRKEKEKSHESKEKRKKDNKRNHEDYKEDLHEKKKKRKKKKKESESSSSNEEDFSKKHSKFTHTSKSSVDKKSKHDSKVDIATSPEKSSREDHSRHKKEGNDRKKSNEISPSKEKNKTNIDKLDEMIDVKSLETEKSTKKGNDVVKSDKSKVKNETPTHSHKRSKMTEKSSKSEEKSKLKSEDAVSSDTEQARKKSSKRKRKHSHHQRSPSSDSDAAKKKKKKRAHKDSSDDKLKAEKYEKSKQSEDIDVTKKHHHGKDLQETEKHHKRSRSSESKKRKKSKHEHDEKTKNTDKKLRVNDVEVDDKSSSKKHKHRSKSRKRSKTDDGDDSSDGKKEKHRKSLKSSSHRSSHEKKHKTKRKPLNAETVKELLGKRDNLKDDKLCQMSASGTDTGVAGYDKNQNSAPIVKIDNIPEDSDTDSEFERLSDLEKEIEKEKELLKNSASVDIDACKQIEKSSPNKDSNNENSHKLELYFHSPCVKSMVLVAEESENEKQDKADIERKELDVHPLSNSSLTRSPSKLITNDPKGADAHKEVDDLKNESVNIEESVDHQTVAVSHLPLSTKNQAENILAQTVSPLEVGVKRSFKLFSKEETAKLQIELTGETRKTEDSDNASEKNEEIGGETWKEPRKLSTDLDGEVENDDEKQESKDDTLDISDSKLESRKPKDDLFDDIFCQEDKSLDDNDGFAKVLENADTSPKLTTLVRSDYNTKKVTVKPPQTPEEEEVDEEKEIKYEFADEIKEEEVIRSPESKQVLIPGLDLPSGNVFDLEDEQEIIKAGDTSDLQEQENMLKNPSPGKGKIPLLFDNDSSPEKLGFRNMPRTPEDEPVRSVKMPHTPPGEFTGDIESNQFESYYHVEADNDSPYNPEDLSLIDMDMSPLDESRIQQDAVRQTVEHRLKDPFSGFENPTWQKILKAKSRHEVARHRRKKNEMSHHQSRKHHSKDGKEKQENMVDYLVRQSRVEHECKEILKSYYKSRDITKDEYKTIMRKAVPQVTMSNSPIIPDKIRSLMKKFVSKCKGQRLLEPRVSKTQTVRRSTATTYTQGLTLPGEQRFRYLNPDLPLPPF